MYVNIKKADNDLQIIYGEVYPPNIPDAQGDYMTVEEVRKMAHNTMVKGGCIIDLQHNGQDTGSVVVESFIAEQESKLYIPESWVLAVYIPDVDLWDDIRSGKINGFSFEGVVNYTTKVIEVEVPENITGETLEANSDHVHSYSVKFSEDGTFLGGKTSLVNGHYHVIKKATVTGITLGHNHRYSFMESLEIVNSTEEA